MFTTFQSAWDDFLRPMFQRPRRVQVAALCYRKTKSGGKKVLLVTSRGTGRWIIPKGWPIPGKGSAQGAMQEAWEEAGVTGRAKDSAIGSYTYDKTHEGGWAEPIEAAVYPVKVDAVADEFPECAERRRRWVSPQEAANLVDEPELKDILREL